MKLILIAPEDIDFYFDEVMNLVDKGMSVRDALRKLKLSPVSFFKRISLGQRNLLDEIKALNMREFSQKEMFDGIRYLNGNIF